MSNNKQSSIEWLMEQITYDNGFGKRRNSYSDSVDLSAHFEKAKAMHKQEIIDSANKLLYRGTGPGDTAAEQYYNETFGGNND